jgi:translation initiation factor 4E
MPDMMPDFSVPYPLARRWAVWAAGGAKPAKGGRGKKAVDSAAPAVQGGFDTIQSMWQWLNTLPTPSRMGYETTLHVFQEGVSPSWEDPRNASGGRWTWNTTQPAAADVMWLRLCLMTCGETLEPDYGAFEITGLVITKKRAYIRISVWTADRLQADRLLRIGGTLKSDLALPLVEYQDHGAQFNVFRYVV